MALDKLETRTHEEREITLLQKLSAQVQHAKKNTDYFGRTLSHIDPSKINTRAALAELPVTRKSELSIEQKNLPPFGGMNGTPLHQLSGFSNHQALFMNLKVLS